MSNVIISLDKMTNDWETTYTELNFIKDEANWKTHIFRKAELPQPADVLECSFLCKNVERQNGCDLFLMEVSLEFFSTMPEFTIYHFLIRIKHAILVNHHILEVKL